jgi:hypothetical protein
VRLARALRRQARRIGVLTSPALRESCTLFIHVRICMSGD